MHSQLKRTTKDVNKFKFLNQVLFKILLNNVFKYRNKKAERFIQEDDRIYGS